MGGPDKTPGPDPRIRIVIHPPDHVIVPSNSSIWLHCSANYTAYPMDDIYADDDYIPYTGNTFGEDYEQNDEPIEEVKIKNDECQSSEVLYQWLRNGQPIQNDSNFQIFCNGTIKITHSPLATAIYRCNATTRQPEIGAVLSKSSDVQAAGLYLNVKCGTNGDEFHFLLLFFCNFLQFLNGNQVNRSQKLI